MTKPIPNKSNVEAGKNLAKTQTQADAVNKLVRAHRDLDPEMTA